MEVVNQRDFVSAMASPGTLVALFSLAECALCQIAKNIFDEASGQLSEQVDRWLVVELDPDPAVFSWLETTFRLTVTPAFAVIADGRVVARRPGIQTKSGTLSSARLSRWLSLKLSDGRLVEASPLDAFQD